jgi:hypothetical protein
MPQPDLGVDDPGLGPVVLGLGVKPPEPEWGLMLNTLRTAIYTQPWAALPGADDLPDLDLVQPAGRRHALGHGNQVSMAETLQPPAPPPPHRCRRPGPAAGHRAQPGQAFPAEVAHAVPPGRRCAPSTA